MTIVNVNNIVTSGFDEDALATATPSEQILNSGTLTTSGDVANGIFANASSVFIRNDANIETGGNGAAGILVQGTDAHIENHATIVTHGGAYSNKKIQFFSEGIDVVGSRYNIANYGNIVVEGNLSSAISGDGD